MIGKSQNPRCFTNINKSTLPVTYHANSKAWMRSDIFIEWLNYHDRFFCAMDRKVVLLIDNAGSHFNPKQLEQSNENSTIVNDHNEEIIIINEESSSCSDNEEPIAESSQSSQRRKTNIGQTQKKREEKHQILILQILDLFIFLLTPLHTYSQWMLVSSIVLKLNTNMNIVNI